MKKFLKKWQKKIEKNAFKSELTWVDSKGKEHTEEVYFKRSTPPLMEGFGDWGRIYPPLNENGKVNWSNLIFGGWRNMLKTAIILGIVFLVFLQFDANFQTIESLRQSCPNLNLNPLV